MAQQALSGSIGRLKLGHQKWHKVGHGGSLSEVDTFKWILFRKMSHVDAIQISIADAVKFF